MTRTIPSRLRLLGVTAALAAGIAGFASVHVAPAPTHLAVVEAFSPAGH
jgi:hypothetical protein